MPQFLSPADEARIRNRQARSQIARVPGRDPRFADPLSTAGPAMTGGNLVASVAEPTLPPEVGLRAPQQQEAPVSFTDDLVRTGLEGLKGLSENVRQGLPQFSGTPGERIGQLGRAVVAPATRTAEAFRQTGNLAVEGVQKLGQDIARGFGGQPRQATPIDTQPVSAQDLIKEQQQFAGGPLGFADVGENITTRRQGDEGPIPEFTNADAVGAAQRIGTVGDFTGPTSTTGMTDEQKAQFEARRQADIRTNVARLNKATAAQRDINAVRKAKAFMALPEGQRGRMPDDVAKVLGRPTEPARGGGIGSGGIGQPSFEEAMADYAAGRVGSEGYKMIRNLRVGNDNFVENARARNKAMGLPPRQRAKAIAALTRGGGGRGSGLPSIGGGGRGRQEGGAAAPSIRDQLDIARFQREGLQDLLKAQQTGTQTEFENKLATAGEQRAQAEFEQESHAAQVEDRQNFIEQLEKSPTMPANTAVRSFIGDTAYSLSRKYPQFDRNEIVNLLQQTVGEVPIDGNVTPQGLDQIRLQVEELLQKKASQGIAR